VCSSDLQLAAAGMVTQVSDGGQINTVMAGDIVSHAKTGAINLMAKNDASLTSFSANANVVGEVSVLLQGKTKNVVVQAGKQIKLLCGKSSIILKSDGTIAIDGMTATLQFTGQLSEHGDPIYLNCDEAGSKKLATPAPSIPGASAHQGSTPPPAPSSLPTVPVSKVADLSQPATVADAPETINLSPLHPTFNGLWNKSFPNGKSQEHGGTLVSDPSGNISIINTQAGTQGEFIPDMTVNKDQKIVGIFHTHPYDKSEGGYTNVPMSAGDASGFINGDEYIDVVQSGTGQYMFLRTAETPKRVDEDAMGIAYDARLNQLMKQGMGFTEATQTATKEVAADNGLAYYEGSNGIFKKVP
jgi:type VI secretion system secreted protein VgrG